MLAPSLKRYPAAFGGARQPAAKLLMLLCRHRHTRVVYMKTNGEEGRKYRIVDSHRNQTFVGLLRRNPDTDCWTWKGHIDFADGHNFSFASQRSFATKLEAENYVRRFACDRIDNRLNLAKADRL